MFASNRHLLEFFSDKVVLSVSFKIAALGERVCSIFTNKGWSFVDLTTIANLARLVPVYTRKRSLWDLNELALAVIVDSGRKLSNFFVSLADLYVRDALVFLWHVRTPLIKRFHVTFISFLKAIITVPLRFLERRALRAVEEHLCLENFACALIIIEFKGVFGVLMAFKRRF